MVELVRQWIHQDVIDSHLGAFTTDTPRIGAVSALAHARRVAPERFIISVSSEENDPDAPLVPFPGGAA
jgi:hypothetical protein